MAGLISIAIGATVAIAVIGGIVTLHSITHSPSQPATDREQQK